MKKRIRALILGIAGLVALGFTAFSVALPLPSKSKEATTEPTKYFLSEQNGQLAVFQSDISTPILLLNVWVDSLPERDIQRIKNGIPADSLNEAISLAEDYE